MQAVKRGFRYHSESPLANMVAGNFLIMSLSCFRHLALSYADRCVSNFVDSSTAITSKFLLDYFLYLPSASLYYLIFQSRYQ